MNVRTNTPGSDMRVKARLLYHNKQFKEAYPLYRNLLKHNRADLEALQVLGTISYRLSKFDEARRCFQKALKLAPGNHELWYQMGLTHQRLKAAAKASRHFERAISIKPEFIQAHLALGNLKASEGLSSQAIAEFETILAIDPYHADARNNLANVLTNHGQVNRAIEEWKHVLKLKPDYYSAYSNLLLALNYSPDYPPEAICEAHKQWGDKMAHFAPTNPRYDNIRDTDRPLRIGYVSGDFREHSVAYFIEPILEFHDKLDVSVYCYSNSEAHDKVSKRLFSHTVTARDISRKDDRLSTEIVRNDKIDILVDLAGHTSGNRLALFARKPAPIQMTYLGYPNTTGLTTIDYRLTDAIADPKNMDDDCYTETLLRLPGGFLCYRPPADAPPAENLPFDKYHYLTFGAFNNTAKTTPKAISVWSEILHRIDDSRLVLKNRSFSDTDTCKYYLDQFVALGVSKDRISFQGLTNDKKQHLSAYQSIDVALDTFPYNGTTTTCDSLWMGVPTITLCGNHHASRVGASLLSQLELTDWITYSEAEYVNKAVTLAERQEQIRELRQSLRQRISHSPLSDGQRIARELESAYRHAWKQWCTGSAP